MWISGRWTGSVSKKTFPIDNPATEEIIDEVPRANGKDADLFQLIAFTSSIATAEEAVRLADDSEYGLGANIYTNNLEHAMYAMENVHAGTFWINDPLTDNDAGPFGGMRKSGIGRELGIEGLDAFREPKHVHMDYKIEAKPYWYPYRWSRLEKESEG